MQQQELHNSSMISHVQYDPETRELRVTFKKSGKTYSSKMPVPAEVYDGLIAAKSAGSYYNLHIAGRYGMEVVG